MRQTALTAILIIALSTGLARAEERQEAVYLGGFSSSLTPRQIGAACTVIGGSVIGYGGACFGLEQPAHSATVVVHDSVFGSRVGGRFDLYDSQAVHLGSGQFCSADTIELSPTVRSIFISLSGPQVLGCSFPHAATTGTVTLDLL